MHDDWHSAADASQQRKMAPIAPCPDLRAPNWVLRGQRGKRACTECNRKKSKCDMLLPSCMSCFKCGTTCVYPTFRQKRTMRSGQSTRRERPAQENGGTEVGLSVPTVQQFIDHPSPQSQPDGSEAQFPRQNAAAQHMFSEYIDFGDSIYPLDPFGTSLASFDISQNTTDTLTASGSESSQGLRSFCGHNNSDSWGTAEKSTAGDDDGLETIFTGEGDDVTLKVDLPLVNAVVHEPQRLPLDSPRDLANDTAMVNQWTAAEKPIDLRLGITWDLFDELATTFFTKVHCFVPILNKPKFVERYVSEGWPDLSKTSQRAIETSLLFHVDRGSQFARRAHDIYWQSLRSIKTPTLEYLQGCTLLAWYAYLSGPDSQGWLLIGTCIRLAHDLEIDKVDLERPDSADAPTAAQWQRNEELRRVWWAIWELDTFASAIGCRPHAIDASRTAVKLPVSDAAWFAGEFIDSALVDPDPLRTWHCLRDCPNQDERAWFLVVNHLLLAACKLSQQRVPAQQAIEDLEKAISCFDLLLPSQFHLDSAFGGLSFNPENFSRWNWVVSTNIMLQGSRSFVRFARERASDAREGFRREGLLAQFCVGPHLNACVDNHRPYAEQIVRVIQRWSPIYIPHTSPFIGCLLLGPAGINVRVAMDRGKVSNGSFIPSIDVEILKLTLSHFARFWKIGAKLLDIANKMTSFGAMAR